MQLAGVLERRAGLKTGFREGAGLKADAAKVEADGSAQTCVVASDWRDRVEMPIDCQINRGNGNATRGRRLSYAQPACLGAE